MNISKTVYLVDILRPRRPNGFAKLRGVINWRINYYYY